MKNIVIYIVCFISINILFSQELFIQNIDQLKGSEKVMGKEYVTVYDNTSHQYRYFDQDGKEIFLIKSFNEEGEEINLSIEKNPITESVEIILDNNPIGFVVNSIIYDLDMIEIGRLFQGRYSSKNINDFWEGIDYIKGNISIYDYTGVYRIGSFMFKKEIDYYSIMGVDKIENISEMSPKILKKTIRNMEKLYKKKLKKYNLKKNPDDIELQEKVSRTTKAYTVIMKDLGVYDDAKFLGIIPKDYFSEEKRTKWSHDEGYVPYSQRPIKEYTPDTEIQKNELYIRED